MTAREGPLVLSRSDVGALLDVDACYSAVEDAFRQQGTREAERPGVLGVSARGGGFHIKAGVLGDVFAAGEDDCEEHEGAEQEAGKKPGRRDPDEIVVFDSTGMALQDVATATAVYLRARAEGRGISVSLVA